MKKLLSICFLSIFLLMFGMQAQAQTDCCFSLSNPGDTLHGIANVPGGDLPLNHSMNSPLWQHTDEYALQFSDSSCSSITGDSKLSIELELWVGENGNMENILDGQHDVSSYCNITMKTTYNELHWIGSPMIGTNYPYAFEYPGAIQIFNGTYNISNVNFDYFFFNFLVNSQTKIMITWNQVFRDVKLIAHLRERIHGTNHEFYWDDQQRQNVGGHQSHPAGILASDTISNAKYVEKNVTIKDCEAVVVGIPAYTMDTTGVYKIAYMDTTKCFGKLDSLITYDYTHYVHPTTPTLSDSTIRYCQKGTATPIVLPDEPNTELADHVADIVPYWYFAEEDSFRYAASFTPVTDTTAGDYYYYVKRHDNLTGCESDIDTFKVTINPNPTTPVVTNPIIEYCVGATAAPLAYAAPTGMQVLWGTDPDIDSLSTATVTPLTTAAGTTIYYLRLQDTTTVNQCVSEGYDSITVRVFANPVVTISHNADSLCYSDVVTLTADPSTLSTYAWSKEGTLLPNDTLYTLTDTNLTTVETFFHYSLAVTEKHDSVTCAANAIDSIKVYPLVGTPAPVRGDTAICGPGDVTLEVAAGTNGTTTKWYKADKTTVIATDTLSYTIHFDATDSVFVSTLNAKGCETPDTSWLKITVTVDTIPTVTLTADNNAEVCAESNMMIRSTVVPAYTPITYAWSGNGLHTPLNEDSVLFNHNTAGQYIDTLTVTDAHGCIAFGTISVTVDSLPVIVKDVNYTVKDNEFCVGTNGKIEFTTPDYVRYSIDSALTWRTTKVFDTLAAGNYNLIVEDSKGCKNHVNPETIIDAPVLPAIATIDSANTRCLTPFNGKLAVQATPASKAGLYEYEYQLNDGTAQTDSVFTGLENGIYKVTVTNTITGCKTDSLDRVVTDGKAIPVPTLASTDNTHCDRPFDGTVSVVSVHPASGAYHYRLAGLIYHADTTVYQTNSLFDTLHDDLYTVFVEDTLTACLGSDTIRVNYNGVLPTATVNGPDYICYGDTNTIFSANITTPNVVFVDWNYYGSVPDTTIDSFRNLDSIKLKNYNTGMAFPPGTHVLVAHIRDTVTHCENFIRDTIRVISVNIELFTIPSTTVCEYDTVKVYSRYIKADPSDSIVTYTWYNGNHVEYAASGVYDTALVIPTNTASYVSLIVEDNHNCSGAFGKTIDVWTLPAFSFSGDTAFCENNNTDIYVSIASTNNPSNIQWWKGTTMLVEETSASSHLVTSVGTSSFDLVVKATDNKGCKNQDTLNITVVANPGAPVFAPDSLYFCEADDINVTYTQALPIDGAIVWNPSDPNVTKAEDMYVAHFELQAQNSTCQSAKDTVYVYVPGKPYFTVDIKYNDDATASTSKQRCYDVAAEDTLKITVNPAASATLTYEYKLNGAAASDVMVITHTDAGVYTDTVNITATHTYPHGGPCVWDTTIVYTLTVDTLPVVPSNFPNSYEGGDSTIFYCEGGTAVYNFNIPAGYSATYNGSATAPTTAYDNVVLVITDDATGCSSTFNYDIVEVKTPVIALTSTLADDCSDTITGEVVANVSGTYPATYERVYTWIPSTVIPASPHTLDVNTDTVTYSFIAPNDTIVKAFVTVNATSGPESSYSASCPSDTAEFVVTFQTAPSTPALSLTYANRIDSTTVAYCYDVDPLTPAITAADFVTSAGATVSIVGTTTIDTAGVYKVVANNDLPPYCPSDTLTLTVIRNREIKEPSNFAGYAGNVYYCEGNTAVYDFGTVENTNDSIVYFNGTTALAAQPDTAGAYIMRIIDKASVITPKCSKDFNFNIVKVANPTATITPHTNWIDTTKVCQGSTIDVDLDFTIVPTVTYTANETFTWTGVTSTTATGHFTATPTADTSVSFAYQLIDTVGAMGYGVACAFSYDSTIYYTFYATPATPVYTGDTAFCAGDSIVVEESSFTLATATTELVATPALPTTFKAASGNVTVTAQYPTFTSCKSSDVTVNIVRHELPVVAIAPHATDTICKGDTSVLKVTGAETYVWSTTATTDSIFATDSIAYSVIGTDTYGCVNYDTVKIEFYPLFSVVMSEDTTVCLGSDATISAQAVGGSGDFTFEWFKDTASTAFITDVLNPNVQIVTPDTSKRVNGVYIPTHYSVLVTDNTYGCVSRAADNYVNVSSIQGPYIIFRHRDSTDNIRHMHVDQGDQSDFEMYIYDKGACPCDDGQKVFVDFRIYKNGVPMSDAELADVLDDYSGSNNMVYEFDLTADAGNISTLTIKSPTKTAEGFFPNISNQEWLGGSSFYFDWFYMHFILGHENGDGSHNGRKIKINTGMWKNGSSGVYTFSYAVVKAGIGAATNNGLCYEGMSLLGGYGSHSGLGIVKDTIVTDFFTIYVGDSVYTEGSDFNFNSNTPTDVVTYSTTEEKSVDMKVYPNPASNNVNVILEGISGQTVITVHDMSGKAVSSMRVDVDNNGQIFNLPVENYSQGIYFIKAVNGDAVMTKKLIIAR